MPGTEKQNQDQQKNDTSSNPNAAKLEAILHLLLSSETDEELEANKEKARKIIAMSDQEIMKLVEQPQQHQRHGDLLRLLR